jgi:hypothetical protein
MRGREVVLLNLDDTRVQMTAISTCTAPSCRTKMEGVVERCPQCDRKMRTPARIRRSGWLLLIPGTLMVGLIGCVSIAIGPMLLHPGEAQDGATFGGTADQARMVLTLFGVLFAFGAVCIVNGVFQIATGRRNLAITIASLMIFAVIVYLTYSTNAALT